MKDLKYSLDLDVEFLALNSSLVFETIPLVFVPNMYVALKLSEPKVCMKSFVSIYLTLNLK